VDKECIADYKSPASLKKKFKESQDYLGRPAMNILANTEYIDFRKFGEKSKQKVVRATSR